MRDKTKYNEWARKYRKAHPEQTKAILRKYAQNNPIVYMLSSARKRSKALRVPFNLEREDITILTHCPVLGIPLFNGGRKHQDNAPSLDRVRPHLGYVRGNIAVISFRANSIKRNASLEEIRAVADWLEQQIGETK